MPGQKTVPVLIVIQTMIASMHVLFLGQYKLLMALTDSSFACSCWNILCNNLQLYKMDGGRPLTSTARFLVGNIVIRTVEFALFSDHPAYPRQLVPDPSNRKGRQCVTPGGSSGNSSWFLPWHGPERLCRLHLPRRSPQNLLLSNIASRQGKRPWRTMWHRLSSPNIYSALYVVAMVLSAPT